MTFDAVHNVLALAGGLKLRVTPRETAGYSYVLTLMHVVDVSADSITVAEDDPRFSYTLYWDEVEPRDAMLWKFVLDTLGVP